MRHKHSQLLHLISCVRFRTFDKSHPQYLYLYNCKMLTKEMLSPYLPVNWSWLLLAAIVAYSSFWILKFIQHRRSYHNLVSLKEPIALL